MTYETRVMSKEEAIKEVKRVFKGNKKYISFCEVMIASSPDFLGINKHEIILNNWNWEKFLSLSIQTKSGFKMIYYRKGNKKYAPANVFKGDGNKTSEIHDYSITTYLTGISEQAETYTWKA
ncbi:hypothetical protein [Mesobacillus thioparans]|uniref:hypothetical protein n=1 Tax=Mesobacillus thioparans TaxID=370439 RepID=UPI0039EF9D00